MQDVVTCEAMFEFMDFWKPVHRIHLGDNWDFRALRRNASEGEQREKISEDIDAGIAFIRRFKPTTFLRGNHDERLWDAAIGDDGKLADFASYVIQDIKEALGDAIMLPYCKRRGVHRIGSLKCVHGFTSGISAARTTALAYGSVLFGHCHVVDQQSIAGLERRIGRCVGALCKLDLPYNRAHLQTLRQQHGFGYGMTFPNGEYIYWQAEVVNGNFWFPSEMRSVSCRKVKA